MKNTAAIYIRRSREIRGSKEAPSGVSREQQEATCRSLAEANGELVTTVAVDWDVSGRKGEARRPGFAQIMDLIRGSEPCPIVQEGRDRKVRHHPTRGRVTTVYAYDLSRLARSTTILREVFDEAAEHGVTVRLFRDSIDTSTANGRLMRDVLASIAEWQAEVASERSKSIVAERKAAGKRIGHPNYGERPGEDASKVVEAYREAGSICGAARLLNGWGVPTRMGGPWATVTTRAVLKRQMALPVRRRRGAKAAAPYAFFRLLRCHCGHVLTGSRFTNGSDPGYTSYKCHFALTVPNHGQGSIPEKRVLAWAKEEAARLEIVAKQGEITNSAERRAEVEDRFRRAGRAYAAGALSDEEFAAERRKRDEDIEVLDDLPETIEMPALDWDWPPKLVNQWLSRIWREVRMGEGMTLPERAEWVIPEWRRT